MRLGTSCQLLLCLVDLPLILFTNTVSIFKTIRINTTQFNDSGLRTMIFSLFVLTVSHRIPSLTYVLPVLRSLGAFAHLFWHKQKLAAVVYSASSVLEGRDGRSGTWLHHRHRHAHRENTAGLLQKSCNLFRQSKGHGPGHHP